MEAQHEVVRRYYLFKTTTSYGFIGPFSVLYLRQQGYGLGVVGFTQAAFLFTIVAFDIPSGYVADRIGRRTGLTVGNAILVVVMATYPFVRSVDGWIVLYIVWGVSWSFHSAIGDAWLYDFLDTRNDSSAFARASGRGESVELTVTAGAALVAGVLYTTDPTFPFLVNAVLAATGIPLVRSLPSTRGAGTRNRNSLVAPRDVLSALRLQLRRPTVRWLVVYSALFNALFSATRWLEQPSLKAIGVPLSGFGVLYATFALVTAGAMLTTGWIRKRFGTRRFFLSLVPLCGFAYATVAFVPAFVIPVIYLRRVLDNLTTPMRN